MAQAIAFAAPTTEEMTRIGAVGLGALATGGVEGVAISMAPKLGGLEPIFTWGTLLGVPAVGVAAALMAKGILGDLGLGIAAGGAAILGYTMPAMLQEFTVAKGKGQLTAEQRAAIAAAAGPGVKQLTAGPLGAAQRAQQAGARVGIEF